MIKSANTGKTYQVTDVDNYIKLNIRSKIPMFQGEKSIVLVCLLKDRECHLPGCPWIIWDTVWGPVVYIQNDTEKAIWFILYDEYLFWLSSFILSVGIVVPSLAEAELLRKVPVKLSRFPLLVNEHIYRLWREPGCWTAEWSVWLAGCSDPAVLYSLKSSL